MNFDGKHAWKGTILSFLALNSIAILTAIVLIYVGWW